MEAGLWPSVHFAFKVQDRLWEKPALLSIGMAKASRADAEGKQSPALAGIAPARSHTIFQRSPDKKEATAKGAKV